MMIEREPTLDELLQEPIVRMLMKADGASESDIRALLPAARSDRKQSGVCRRSAQWSRVPIVSSAMNACCSSPA